MHGNETRRVHAYTIAQYQTFNGVLNSPGMIVDNPYYICIVMPWQRGIIIVAINNAIRYADMEDFQRKSVSYILL